MVRQSIVREQNSRVEIGKSKHYETSQTRLHLLRTTDGNSLVEEQQAI